MQYISGGGLTLCLPMAGGRAAWSLRNAARLPDKGSTKKESEHLIGKKKRYIHFGWAHHQESGNRR